MNLAQAVAAQATGPGQQATGDDNGDAIEAKYRQPRDLAAGEEHGTPHWHTDQRQAPTSAVQVRGQSPSMQYIASQIPERKSEDLNTAGDANGPDQYSNKVQATGNGGYAIPTDISEQQALANSDPATAAAYKAMQAKNAANPIPAAWAMALTRGGQTSIAGPGGNEVPTTDAAIAQAQAANGGQSFDQAIRGIYNAGGTPQGPAAAYANFIQNAGLNKDQIAGVNALVQAGGKPAEVMAAVRDYQAQNASNNRAANESWKGQGTIFKSKVDTARGELTHAQANFAKTAGNPLASDEDKTAAQKSLDDATGKYNDAMTTWSDHLTAGPQTPAASSNATPAVMPVNPRLAGQVRQGGPPITVNSEAELRNVPPGTTVMTPRGPMFWDGQRLTPVNQ
jgi:hypothetical protein